MGSRGQGADARLTSPGKDHPARRIAVAAGIALACVAAVALAGLAAVDAGMADRALASWASRRLHRPVQFASLDTRLLAAAPTILIRGLKVGNPAWAGPGDLLDADRISLTFLWPDLLSARLTPSEIELDRPVASLVRVSPERDNWSSGTGGGGGSLGHVKRLLIVDGRFTLDDRVRALRLSGTVSHDARRNPGAPFSIAAHGVLKGGEVSLNLSGGALNGQRASAAYPFAATLQDGLTGLSVRGTSVQPLQLRGFDLAVEAHGPNLADMKYLIGVGLPNSAPYGLTARLAREGQTTRATGLRAVVGRSDFAGSIVSDGSGPRRVIRVELSSNLLEAGDVGPFFAHIPEHAVTRSTSGAATPRRGARGPLLTTQPIDLKRFTQKDAKLRISARRFVIDGVAPGALKMEATLDRGRLDVRPFTVAFPAGAAQAVMGIDLNGPKPAFRLDATVRGRLGALVPSLAETLDGRLDWSLRAGGTGGSWREVGLNAAGRTSLRLDDGTIQKSKAKVLSGAVIQGALTALADKRARVALACAVIDADIGRGRIGARKIVLATDAGAAIAVGGIDLASETIDLTVYGRPSRFRLFSVDRPVSVGGPMLSPQAKIHLGSSGPSAATPKAPKIEGDPALLCAKPAG